MIIKIDFKIQSNFMISNLTSQVAERELIFLEREYATANIMFSVSLILNQYFLYILLYSIASMEKEAVIHCKVN